MNPLYLIAAYLLGALTCGVIVLVVLVKLHKRPAPPLTMYRRQWRDRRMPGAEYAEVPPTVRWEARADEDGRGVNYQWVNLTGEER